MSTPNRISLLLIVMRNSLIPLVLLLVVLNAGASEPIKLWPQGVPGETSDMGVEHDTTGQNGGLVDGKRVIRLGNVSVPTITFYPSSSVKDNGATMIVCPGGGYHILAMDLEGTEVCQWLNSIGMNAVLLKYRVPASKGLERYAAPLQDAQRALSLVRSHAAEWKIDPNRIGIMGFSAGGHLSAAASTGFTKRTYKPIDPADKVSCRPDFTMLIYPAYLIHQKGPELSPELTVNSDTPPTFIFQTEDDPIPVEGSLYYYLALKQAKVPAEMHLFASGGHGYGLRGSNRTPKSWPKLAEKWMRGLDILKIEKP